MGSAGGDPLTRARYLPAAVEIAVAGGDLDGAQEASADLTSIAAKYAGPVLAAAALEGEGVVALARGDAVAAIASLRDAALCWRSAGAPYEAARSRFRVARAAAALGDGGGAAREARGALAAFEQLGARLDIEAATRFLDHLARPVT